ncbi:MAG: amidohydrolase, partial [Chitinophagaceae bacterium]
LKQQSPLYWHNFIEVSGFVDAGAPNRLAAAEGILGRFQNLSPTTVNHHSHSLSPHAPYSVSKNLFRLLNEKTAGQLITIHNQEAEAENELYRRKSGRFLDLYNNFGIDITGFEATGRSSLQSWLPYFNKDQRIIAVHNSFIGQEDVEQARALHFCLCINANLYIENVLPPVEMLVQNDCNIILGTDSYASNHSLNIMAEINMVQQHFPAIPLEIILQWATLNGAKALGIDNRFGSFDKHKQPGLVLIKEGVARRVIT